jgi:hypothetical protein
MPKWKPELSFDDTLAEARGIAGHRARIRYDARRPRTQRHSIERPFDEDTYDGAGSKRFAIVAVGGSWREALDRARLQVAEFQRFLDRRNPPATPESSHADEQPDSTDAPPQI